MGDTLLFMVLRDTSGTIQLMFTDHKHIVQVKEWNNESVVVVKGKVKSRPRDQKNKVNPNPFD